MTVRQENNTENKHWFQSSKILWVLFFIVSLGGKPARTTILQFYKNQLFFSAPSQSAYRPWSELRSLIRSRRSFACSCHSCERYVMAIIRTDGLSAEWTGRLQWRVPNKSLAFMGTIGADRSDLRRHECSGRIFRQIVSPWVTASYCRDRRGLCGCPLLPRAVPRKMPST